MRLDRALLFNVPELTVLLLTTPAGAAAMQSQLRERAWIRTLILEPAGHMAATFFTLRTQGVRTLSCVGGRTLAGALLAENLVDDLYLTSSPRPGGEPGTPLPASAFRGRMILKKRGTDEETGVTFAHWHFQRAAKLT